MITVVVILLEIISCHSVLGGWILSGESAYFYLPVLYFL